MTRLAYLAATAAEAITIATLTCLFVAVSVLTDAEPQAELEPEEPEPGPWSWAELRQQPVARATLDAVDVMALREAEDVVGLVTG